MAIEFRRKGDVQIVDFKGRITIDEVIGTLKSRFVEALDSGERRFVFNFASTPYLDSTTIGETMACHKRARERGGAIRLVVPASGRVYDILHLTALDRIIEIDDDEETAIRGFAP